VPGQAFSRIACMVTVTGNPFLPLTGSGIVKLFENTYLWLSRCECTVRRNVVADCVFHAAAAVMIWFQAAKRLVISVRHWGALIR
jgi:hypothetical protein